MTTLGGPILLKQGYMQRKGLMGWKRQYYRLLQDSLFQFTSHDSKTPTDEVTLMGGGVEDGSWNAKRANCLQISTERGRKEYFVCDNSDEHKQWFDAVYYATTVSKLAEYCSPLSGGWLHFYEGKNWVRRWFMVKDSFLLCYDSREDVNPATTSGAPVNRRFVLPLSGAVIAYHKTVMPFSFSVQMFAAGELKNEFIFAAASEPIMNVWMEVLYVSTGKELPGLEDEGGEVALEIETRLTEIDSGETPAPSRRHRENTHGHGIDPKQRPTLDNHGFGGIDAPESVGHGAKAPPPASKQQERRPSIDQVLSEGLSGLGMGAGGGMTHGDGSTFGGGLPASFGDLNDMASYNPISGINPTASTNGGHHHQGREESFGGSKRPPSSSVGGRQQQPAPPSGGTQDKNNSGISLGGIKMPWDVEGPGGKRDSGCNQQ